MRHAGPALALLALCAVGGLCVTCSGDDPEPALARYAAGNAEADRRLDSGDEAAARRALEELLVPGALDGLAEPDRRALRRDLLFRRAQIQLLQSQPAAALASSDEGIALEAGEDLFLVNLLITRGQALEALGRDLDAAAAYHRALLLAERALDESLGDPAPRRTP